MYLNQSQLPSVEPVEIVPSAAQYDGADEVPVGGICLRPRPYEMSGYAEQRPFTATRSGVVDVFTA